MRIIVEVDKNGYVVQVNTSGAAEVMIFCETAIGDEMVQLNKSHIVSKKAVDDLLKQYPPSKL